MVRFLKFTDYVQHYKSLSETILGLILKSKSQTAATGVSLMVIRIAKVLLPRKHFGGFIGNNWKRLKNDGYGKHL